MDEHEVKMLNRRGLLGAFLAAPIIIRTPGLLMPVRRSALLPVSTSDIEWMTHQMDYGFCNFVGGQYRTPEGRLFRHAVGIPDFSAPNLALARDIITEKMEFFRLNPDWKPAPLPPRVSRYVARGVEGVKVSFPPQHFVKYVNKGVARA